MARTRKFIVQPSEEILSKFPDAVRKLVKKGREQGFVTQQELLKAVPNVENDLLLLDEIYSLFLDLGIDVIDVKDEMIWRNKEEEEQQQIKDKKNIELKEIANDSIRLYLCEIGKVPLLTAK